MSLDSPNGGVFCRVKRLLAFKRVRLLAFGTAVLTAAPCQRQAGQTRQRGAAQQRSPGGAGGASAPQAVTVLTLSANAHDFLRLAQRLDDPDTLFFNRSLSMEGDTELGLMVKNTLDALTLPVLDLRALAPIRLATRLAGWHAAASRPHTGNDRHA